MNSSSTELEYSSTTEAADDYGDSPDYEYDFDALQCGYIRELSAINIAVYANLIIGAPMHIFIIWRLVTKVPKKRGYHYFIIVLSSVDLIRLSYVPVLCNAICLIFIYSLDDYVTQLADLILVILCATLMVYWKHVILTQKILDSILFVVVAISSIAIIAKYVINDRIEVDQNISNILAYITEAGLTFVSLVTFFLVVRMDVSKFSEVTVKGQKKLAATLFLQLACQVIYYSLDLWNYYLDYLINNSTDEGLQGFDLDRYFMWQKIQGIYGSLLPSIRGILMYWAVKPLLYTTTVIVISRSISSIHTK